MIDTDHNQNSGEPSEAQEAMRRSAKLLEKELAAASGDAAQLPRYQCHKKVWALKIKSVALMDSDGIHESDGSATITPEDDGYSPFMVGRAFVEKHKPVAGGYYVVYDDGYKSFSPAKAFEDGYTLL